MPQPRLEDLVLTAFRRAEAAGRRDAAEHLLRALEALCPRTETTVPGSALAQAYRDLARKGPPSGARPDQRAGGTARRRGGAKGRPH